uniref:Facilitated trehalose transporter Tret1 n=1 Tax=Cacopsylla melanoneura TaxID=428564 RepID=A0A8D8XDK6_9HEMI
MAFTSGPTSPALEPLIGGEDAGIKVDILPVTLATSNGQIHYFEQEMDTPARRNRTPSVWFTGTTRQILAGMSASLSAFSVGQTFGWSSPVLDLLTSDESPVPMTDDQSSWVVASVEFGCWSIPFFAGMLADQIGRKWTLMTTGPLYALSWAIAIYSRSVWGLYTFRIIQGLCVATVFVVCPLFLGEISETKIRGAVGTLFQISLYLGILYTYILGELLSYQDYQIANLLVAILFMITFMLVPETPCYYIKKGRDKDALKTFQWYRAGRDEKDILEEFEQAKETIQNDNRAGTNSTLLSVVTDRTNLKCILLLQGLLVFRTFVHVQTIMAYYVSTRFGKGETFISPNYISMLYAAVLMLSNLPATYLVDKAGRKILIVISTAGCSVFSFLSFGYYFAHEHLQLDLPIVCSYINFVSICMIGVFFSLGIGPLYSPLCCEYFPSNTRAKSSALMSFSGTTLQMIDYKLFYFMYMTWGMYSNFLLAGIISAAGLVWCSIYIVETKGKSFAEIQAMFTADQAKKDEKNERNKDVRSEASSVL